MSAFRRVRSIPVRLKADPAPAAFAVLSRPEFLPIPSAVSSVLITGNDPAAQGLLAGRLAEAGYACPNGALAASEHRLESLREEVLRRHRRVLDVIQGLRADAAHSVLLASIEARCPDLYDHAQRVARSAASLAQALRLAREDVRAIRTAALLRDVGKVVMPASLLGGSGPLDDEEIAIVRSQVTIGAELLRNVTGFQGVADLVRASREQFDGNGYPARLAGTAIPIGARIIAVAAAYDTLTSPRACDDPLTHDGATAELVRRAGTQLDPDVVRAWLDLTERARCC
jgi:response regulator RpfG family c-di-GMP phosphodiesterase